ncbi:MAG: WxcM-like domain-containing protein [Janthinobacterium svalbardensis]|uniref:Isomerase n=1 Tax=Janthinobacterium svalbardensis TaxID=368607 RepID=A0A290X1F2_9BURK|nr:WxcM-like domain-containing protein [Janthinobacterium svalbardensis]ATD62975.1 isomerase [Janthinobacterium svalbardensis]
MTEKKHIHSHAIVEPGASIGAATNVWAFAHVLGGARIGAECNICDHVFIENDVVLGDRVTVKCGVQLWDGITIGDDVFIGPNATFANDKFPRSKQYLAQVARTSIRRGASIGAGAVILPGIIIAENAMVGAGAVVTKNVPAHAIVVGNPARVVGYTNASPSTEHGPLLGTAASSEFTKDGALSNVNGVRLYKFPLIKDIRGSLSVGEFQKEIPFDAARYFLVFDVPSKELRGEHAHHACHQFLICVHGSCAVVADDGNVRQEYMLDAPNLGIYLPPLTWGVQYKYSPDAVLLVFASHVYDADDYIRDYSDFLRITASLSGADPVSSPIEQKK